MDGELPPGWAWVKLGEVCEINPGTDTSHLTPDDEVAFIPMASVSELSNVVDASRRRPHREVSKGFTRFAPADVIFAKITPCMENGKIALVPEVPGGVAYGSTEFHVIRARAGIAPAYVRHYVSQQSFRDNARAKMSGAVGQQRVPVDFLRDAPIPIAPPAEQAGIASEIDALFTDLDTAEAALGRAREGVEQFRASLLHAACTGALTAAWREANPPTETGADLLRRILAERRATWERTEHTRLTAKGTPPMGNAWKARYVEPADLETSALPELPAGWAWASVDQLTDFRGNGLSRAPDGANGDLPILRISAVRPLRVNLAERRFYRAEADERLDGATAQDGDLLFTRYSGSEQYVGVCGRLRSGGPILYPDKVMCARLDAPFVGIGSFLECALNGGVSRQHINANIRTTAGQKGIAGSSVKACPVPLPPLAEIAEIATAFGDLLEAAEMPVLEHTKILASVRQSILHAAFTGRLVPQDPADEPAGALLARLRAAPPPRRTRAGPVKRRV